MKQEFYVHKFRETTIHKRKWLFAKCQNYVPLLNYCYQD